MKSENKKKPNKKIGFNDLTYHSKGLTTDAIFDNAINLLKKIGKCETTLQDAKSNQKNYKSNLNEIKREEENLKIDQISKKNIFDWNIKMLYKSRKAVITCASKSRKYII